MTVTSFAPLRHVPFDVVVLLGLDDASVESTEALDGAFGAPRVGDPDRRADQRGALLASVLSARSRLIVTYDGTDLVTNEDIASTPVLSELFEAVDRVLADDVSTLVRSHPRHAHGEDDLREVGARRPFSFDRNALQRARELADASAGGGARVLVSRAPHEPVGRIHHVELARFLKAPQRTFLREALGVRLPQRDPPPEDELPTTIEGLERWKLVADLVDRGLASGADTGSTSAWTALAETWADEPDHLLSELPGRLGRLALLERDGIAPRARTLCEAVSGQIGFEEPEVVRCDVALEEGGSVYGDVHVYRGGKVIDWTPSANDHKVRIDSIVRLLLLAAARPAEQWVAVRIWRDERRGVRVAHAHVPGDTPAERESAARSALGRLMGLRRRGLTEVLPLFFGVSMDLIDALGSDPGMTRDALLAAVTRSWDGWTEGGDAKDPAVRYCFDGGIDDLLAIPRTDEDPFTDAREGESRALACTFAFADGLLALEPSLEEAVP